MDIKCFANLYLYLCFVCAMSPETVYECAGYVVIISCVCRFTFKGLHYYILNY